MTIDELKEQLNQGQRKSADNSGRVQPTTESDSVNWRVLTGIIELLEAHDKELRRLDAVKLQSVSFNQRALEELIRKIVKEEAGPSAKE